MDAPFHSPLNTSPKFPPPNFSIKTAPLITGSDSNSILFFSCFLPFLLRLRLNSKKPMINIIIAITMTTAAIIPPFSPGDSSEEPTTLSTA